MKRRSIKSLTVAVLMGGRSAEAQVSRNSAKQVADALHAGGHDARLVELDADCAQVLLTLRPDVVFPALHGPPGEDGTVQGFLEILELPYVGSPVRGSALAMDKAVAKRIFAEHGLPVAPGLVIARDRTMEPAKFLSLVEDDIVTTLGPCVVIKPLNQGSAIGVTPLPNGGDISAAIERALVFGDCMVEPYISGREITAGVLQVGDEMLVHPVIEIITASDQWYDYENRYTPGQSEHIVPARLNPGLSDRLQEIAVSAHRVLGLRDLSRADFILTDEDEITLLEVNTLPGMTRTSLYPEGARHIGYEFSVLVDLLVRQAAERG